MKPIELSPLALQDLDEIGLYMADHNPARALTFLAELKDTAVRAGARPKLFAEVEGIGRNLRSARHGRYRIYFRELADQVRIVRILHSARNLAAIADAGGLD